MTSITEGKAGLLRLRQRLETTARRLAVVSVHPAGHPGADLAWDHYPARNPGEFSRSYARLTGDLSAVLCHRLLWGCAARGNRLARLRAAPHATTLWATVGHPAPGCLVGFLAFAILPDAGSWGRARHQLCHLPHKLLHFSSDGYGIRHHLYVGLQPHRRKHFHRQSCCMPPSTPHNLFGYHSFSPWTRPGLNLATLIAFGVPALLIVILTRGRLGYQQDQEKTWR